MTNEPEYALLDGQTRLAAQRLHKSIKHYVLKLEPYAGDDSELITWFADEKEENAPMYVIVEFGGEGVAVCDYGYRTREEANEAISSLGREE